MMRLFYIFLSLILMTSSSFAAGPSQKALKAKCLKAGGEWDFWSKYDASRNLKTCRIIAKDAGKACNDGKECSVGLCEYDVKTKSGKCHTSDSENGCHTWMTDGKAGPTTCVD